MIRQHQQIELSGLIRFCSRNFCDGNVMVLVWHTKFDKLSLRWETLGAQSFAPDLMVKYIPLF